MERPGWPRDVADSLARVLGLVILMEGIGIVASAGGQLPFLMVGFILTLAGLAGSTLPETGFWGRLFEGQ